MLSWEERANLEKKKLVNKNAVKERNIGDP
jgi:hypothetical protein